MSAFDPKQTWLSSVGLDRSEQGMRTEEHVEIETPWLVTHLSRVLVGLLGLALIAGAATAAAYVMQFGALGLSTSQEIWANFGDFIGGTLNVVVGYCALIALALTLRVQSIELKLSTQELSRSAKALAEQNKSLAQQSFENTFFQLLRLHNENVSGLDLRRSGNLIAEGRDCFKIFFNRMETSMNPFMLGHASFESCYADFNERNGQNVGHYFRHLYRIYKFIAESDVEDKRSYSGIVRAQLSNYELALLFYNGLSSYGIRFKPLLEEFAGFENMDFNLLPNWDNDKLTYARRAFGDRADLVGRKVISELD